MPVETRGVSLPVISVNGIGEESHERGASAAAAGPSSGRTYTSSVFGPGWAGRTVRPTNTLPAAWPRVRSSAWGSAGLAAAAVAAGLAAVIDTGRAALHATLASIIAGTSVAYNRLQ